MISYLVSYVVLSVLNIVTFGNFKTDLYEKIMKTHKQYDIIFLLIPFSVMIPIASMQRRERNAIENWQNDDKKIVILKVNSDAVKKISFLDTDVELNNEQTVSVTYKYVDCPPQIKNEPKTLHLKGNLAEKMLAIKDETGVIANEHQLLAASINSTFDLVARM